LAIYSFTNEALIGVKTGHLAFTILGIYYYSDLQQGTYGQKRN